MQWRLMHLSHRRALYRQGQFRGRAPGFILHPGKKRENEYVLIFAFHETKHFMSGKLPLQFYTRYVVWNMVGVRFSHYYYSAFFSFCTWRTRSCDEGCIFLVVKLYDGVWRIFQALYTCEGNLGLHKNEIAKNRYFQIHFSPLTPIFFYVQAPAFTPANTHGCHHHPSFSSPLFLLLPHLAH